MKIRIAFLIRRLDRGGSERQLIDLSRGLNKQKFDVTILTFYAGGDFAAEVTQGCGVRLICLNKSGRLDMLVFLGRLLGIVRRLRPHIIHGYMGVANELSIIAGRVCGARVVWGLRSSNIAVVQQPLTSRWLFQVGRVLSRHPDRIIANSERGREFHISRGYRDERMTVIPNGIDTQRFSRDAEKGEAVRREWNVAANEVLIGRAARLDPLKDYPSFLKSAAIVGRSRPDAKFVCIGDDTDCSHLHGIAAREGIADRMIWAGGRSDMPAVYNALDICVSSSLSEGFPNAIAEPMACGTPCVATDVGDSALVVGDGGVIVPVRDHGALANAVLRVAANRQLYPRYLVRKRITDNFSLERMVARSEEEFERLLVGKSLFREMMA